MSRLFVTGDTHGPTQLGPYSFDGYLPRFSMESFQEQKDLSRDDYVLIAGDFGGVWAWARPYLPEGMHWMRHSGVKNYRELAHGESKEERYSLDLLEEQSFTTLFVPGNHENYDRLYHAYPIVSFHGGRAVQIREHIFMLMSGYMYDIAGLRVFAFGGARSHDITDGILDPESCLNYAAYREEYEKWCQTKGLFRVRHISWWEEEIPDRKTMEFGLQTLEENSNSADLIITHCAPASLVPFADSDVLQDYLQSVMDRTDYRYWVFGHYHDNQAYHRKGHEMMLYEQIVRLV
ncbi:MAG: metallophosphoesterase [Lachnospiraceae bacterium]|nr:metallophosphoesterase [Lachnospiraceae bacterium]